MKYKVPVELIVEVDDDDDPVVAVEGALDNLLGGAILSFTVEDVEQYE